MFNSNGLTSPKWSPAWLTPRLKLSRVQVHRVTIFSIWVKMGLCADTGYVQSASFSIIYFTSILLKSGVIFVGITLISDGVLSWVSWLNLFMENIDVTVCASLPWGLATWRESVEADCQSAIYEATRPEYCIAFHHVLSHSLPGVGRFETHIIAHIFTIHWGLPSPPFFKASFASGYSRLRCACDLGNAPWGMAGCTGFRNMGAGPKIRHVSMT